MTLEESPFMFLNLKYHTVRAIHNKVDRILVVLEEVRGHMKIRVVNNQVVHAQSKEYKSTIMSMRIVVPRYAICMVYPTTLGLDWTFQTRIAFAIKEHLGLECRHILHRHNWIHPTPYDPVRHDPSKVNLKLNILKLCLFTIDQAIDDYLIYMMRGGPA